MKGDILEHKRFIFFFPTSFSLNSSQENYKKKNKSQKEIWK